MLVDLYVVLMSKYVYDTHMCLGTYVMSVIVALYYRTLLQDNSSFENLTDIYTNNSKLQIHFINVIVIRILDVRRLKGRQLLSFRA